jgi:hypothetical protein
VIPRQDCSAFEQFAALVGAHAPIWLSRERVAK